jgi:50S ribosomal protein L16 3-hydroxylase
LTGFQNFDVDIFLREYWQRKPLLIKNALPGFQDPLSPEELAGLALEDEIESRLVETSGETWKFEQGPFTDKAFNRSNPWTLLVQAVDHYLDEIAELKALVNFIPNWRFDDVMISYATPGGGVGPHYDNYDVFLVQGQGQRTWKLGQVCDEEETLIDHPKLRILNSFETSAEHTLGPGDVLYVPPRLAHWGTAVTECLTYSLGFRAPRLNDMLSREIDRQLESLSQEQLYTDPKLSTSARTGEIQSAAIETAIEQLKHQLADLGKNMDWFGELVTEPRETLAPLKLVEGQALRLDPAARVAWRELDGTVEVYANGDTLQTSTDQIEGLQLLCSGQYCTAEALTSSKLVLQLAERGCLTHD